MKKLWVILLIVIVIGSGSIYHKFYKNHRNVGASVSIENTYQ